MAGAVSYIAIYLGFLGIALAFYFGLRLAKII